jgi:hypothetical protein
MPEKATRQRARKDRRQGKAATTQAGEYVREEMEHVKRGKHGARSRKQVVAIGLSKARRDGVKVPSRNRSRSRTRVKGRARGRTGARRGSNRSRSRSRGRSRSRSRSSSSRR